MTVALWAVAARAMPPRVGPTPARAAQPSRAPSREGKWHFPPGPAPAPALSGKRATITDGWLASAPARLARGFLAG
jgi:hypothetical protein